MCCTDTEVLSTLGPAYNEQKVARETARYKWVLALTELFNMAVNDFDAKQSARYSRVLVVTELVLSGTQCKCFHFPVIGNSRQELKIGASNRFYRQTSKCFVRRHSNLVI